MPAFENQLETDSVCTFTSLHSEIHTLAQLQSIYLSSSSNHTAVVTYTFQIQEYVFCIKKAFFAGYTYTEVLNKLRLLP